MQRSVLERPNLFGPSLVTIRELRDKTESKITAIKQGSPQVEELPGVAYREGVRDALNWILTTNKPPRV